jgi:hypothetical protein|tara:strand:- start:183 stop:1334 length:1152 start_codon:yes stop_codon:yes gene_type:complete
MSIQFKELVRVYDQYENQVDEKTKQYLAGFGTVDSSPKGLPLMEDIIDQYDRGEIPDGGTYICEAKVGDLWSDPIYNRILELRYGNQKKHIENRGGYSNDAADTLSAYLRPSLKAVLTKGNNRASMRGACGRDPNARVIIALKLHPKNISHEEMIRIESLDHNTDCNYRTNQSGDDKFKSAYYASETWATDLYKYLEPFNIGIAGTLDDAKFTCPSHSYMSTALRLAGREYTSKYLTAFTRWECATDVQGNATVAGALFLKTFHFYIDDVDKKNGIDSFSQMMKWFFTEYGPAAQAFDPDAKNLQQSDIVQGNGVYKGNEPAIARFVFLYNDFCRIKRLKFNGTQKTAIPFEGSDSSAWNEFLGSSNPLMKPALGNLATTKFF